ncbi:N-formylglutamate amidohydrolase [Sulfurimonas aquatica]|nr:N-formylglutamate amidohydrolase [Sulfurimonas aquatica]
MILHIPHSSTDTLDYKFLHKERELLRMTDHYTDDLYGCADAKRVVFELSRLVCDVERFQDDEQEPMSRFGMGVCYTKNSEGNKLRVVTDANKEYIISNYYIPHHHELSSAVDDELAHSTKALIIDCHSFPDKAYRFNNDFNQKRPDICIGTDSYHTPKGLLEETKKYFLSKGYVVQVNKPYSGSIVPMKHYKKDKRVLSIMIEINRKLYMDEHGFKTEHYEDLKEEIHELLIHLNHLY